MISRVILNRAIITSFLVLVGFCLAKSIYHRSIMGIILAITSLVAAVYFLYLVAKANEQRKQEVVVNDEC